MAEPVLRLAALVREFGGGAGLHGVDLDVRAGEVHALVGLNGAGKTTLMRTALGMLRPDAGEVRVHGTRLPAATASTWRRVGHLVDAPFAYPELDVRTNLRLAARLHGLAPDEARRRTDAIVAELELTPYASVRARRLSAGNRQRVGIAAALQHDPGLVVLDEPTNALDPRGVILLREALVRRAEAGAGILVSSHHLDEVARIADRITVMNDGRVVGALEPGGTDLERAFFALVLADDEERAS
ncbi:ABC-2 type transport system ATP-binding protein [Mumia flava]|uniref:ABC-2 type transport system ATP-binding protein n=1 Tax=Mumia flava TaxID=1348852 RepID=A0A0B2BFE3_9ACTN|nr:ABC transporter ATP-binding protein [Mumia flava]PJJ57183.1 ABC-2 type transport system ATP-binding protein [Mumia flava]